MSFTILSCKLILLFYGTLYPIYNSYKAIKNRNARQYLQCTIYWIVYAMFAGLESIAYSLINGFSVYYQVKVVITVLLLLNPNKSANLIYLKVLHPIMEYKESEIDYYLNCFKERGLAAFIVLGSQVVEYVSQLTMVLTMKQQMESGVRSVPIRVDHPEPEVAEVSDMQDTADETTSEPENTSIETVSDPDINSIVNVDEIADRGEINDEMLDIDNKYDVDIDLSMEYGFFQYIEENGEDIEDEPDRPNYYNDYEENDSEDSDIIVPGPDDNIAPPKDTKEESNGEPVPRKIIQGRRKSKGSMPKTIYTLKN